MREVIIGEKTYTLSDMRLKDWRAIRDWVQWLPYENLRRNKERLEEAEYREEIAKVRSECARNQLTEFDYQVLLTVQSLDGMERLLQLELHQKHPDCTLEWVQANVALDWYRENAEDVILCGGLKADNSDSKKKDQESPST